MTANAKQLAKFIVRIIITTALLIWVFSQIDIEKFLKTVRSARWQYLLAVWVFTVILFWIRSIKMRVILRKQGCLISTNTVFGATAATCLYSLFLPGILSTGVKWYILQKGTGKASNVLCSMIYNQWLVMTIMTVFGLAALIFTNPAPLLISDAKHRWILPVVCGILLAAIIIVTVLLLNRRTGGMIIRFFAVILAPLPEKIRQKGLMMLEQIATFQTAGARFHLGITAASIIDTLGGGVIVYILSARAANVTAPTTTFVWLCAVIYVLGRIPISIANLGVREATLVLLLAPYGVPKSQALLMSMILFSALVVMAVIGAGYQIIWTLSRKRTRPPINNA
jgi:hypothetical protein